jgi:hypothetical protein
MRVKVIREYLYNLVDDRRGRNRLSFHNSNSYQEMILDTSKTNKKSLLEINQKASGYKKE